MFLFAVRTYVRSLETSGKAMSLEFAMTYMFSEDTITLFISDGVLVLSTIVCVPFAKAVANGWIKYSYTGVIIQHLWQTAVLFTAIKWAFHRCVESVIHSSALWSLELLPSTNGSRR